MMPRNLAWVLTICVTACAVAAAAPQDDGRQLKGEAEDLWGTRIRLEETRGDPVIIHPFSPSNCGYCLFEGDFVRENYLSQNVRSGGSSFQLCLFNPQLDIHAFQKHQRDTTPVLTFPPDLYRLHGDGFPWLISFREKRLVESDSLMPYEATFRRLAPRLWPGRESPIVLTSPIQMAANFMLENRNGLSVIVLADGDQTGRSNWLERIRRWKSSPGEVRFESELKEADLRQNLFFAGTLEGFRHEALERRSTPIEFDRSTIRIGGRAFAKSGVRLNACFPNPHNPERYVLIEGGGGSNAVDYTVSRRKADGGDGWEILLQGNFQKAAGNRWSFAESLAFGSQARVKRDEGDRPRAESSDSRARASDALTASSWEAVPGGRARALGSWGSHFPSLAISPTGACWAAWEQGGNIHAAPVENPAPPTLEIEADPSDSFHPVIVPSAKGLVVVYLNARDGVYRVKLREIEGSRLASEALVSGDGPFDAVTPAAALDAAGNLVVVWSEWRANQRFLLTRSVQPKGTGPVGQAVIRENDDGYVNAWWPALTCDARGRIWGAWNQHYPSTLGVCAGDLVHAAVSVTRLATAEKPEENGGYPSVAVDGDGTRWIFWESSAWRAIRGESQQIRSATLDPDSGAASPGGSVSDAAGTFFNQTPRAATDGHGRVWVVWSGRDRQGTQPWGVYLIRREDGRWTAPLRLSATDENARAPTIATKSDGRAWIAWHSGVGDRIRIRVLEYGRD